jgi:hypothetical protein
MASFSGSSAGTSPTPGPKSQPRHPGDKPQSLSGEEYKAMLERETDASIRLDLAKYGEIRRWSWRTLQEVKEAHPVK